MSILTCRDCGVDIAGEPLFRHVSFSIEAGQKVGLVGPNGAGKTTLLKTCLGMWRLESGEVYLNVTYGYLEQTPELSEKGTVFQSMLEERGDVLELRERLSELELKMGSGGEKVFEQYGHLTEEYERLGGYALETQVRRIITGLGLEQDANSLVVNLSGGQKRRLSLAKLLLKAPELLILDEPTNHLDIEAMEWLENFLKDYSGSLLIVSHDRYLLDRVVTQIFALEHGELKTYKGNYSEYELQRAHEEKTQAREAQRMAKKIARLEEYVRKYRAGIKAKQARGREAQLKKLKPLDVPQERRALTFGLKAGLRSGDKVLEITDLSIRFKDRVLFRGLNLDLRRGDRVALLGRNGIGKTSLLRAVMDRLPFEGSIRIGAQVKVGYYSQEHEELELKGSVMDEIRYASQLDDPQIRNLLARFGFYGEDVFKPAAVLSGGEKSRLALCKLFLAKGNLLLLDEPTNHLDFSTRDVLEEALKDYDGTIFTVSHDRYFLDQVVNKIAYLSPHGIELFEGDYTSFKEYREEISRNLEKETSKTKQAKLEHEAAKEARRQQRKLEQMELEIRELETYLEDLKVQMEENATDYEKTLKLHENYEEAKEQLNSLMEQWLEASS